MKKLILLLMLCSGSLFGQGKFAGAFRTVIGKVYNKESELTELNGFTYRGGTLLSDINDPEKFSGSYFSRGSTIVALFELIDENERRHILDVLEIKNVSKNQELKIGDCKNGDEVSVEVLALVKTTKAKEYKAIKSWRFNRDKNRIDMFSPSKVTCVGMMEGD